MIKSPRFLFSIIIMFPFFAHGQINDKRIELLDDRNEWSEGSILMNTGEELIGMLNYKGENNILTYTDGTSTRVFGPRSVSGFEFFDESTQKQRVFYILKYIDDETDVPRDYFFELLKDFGTIAFFSKVDPVVGEKQIVTNKPSPLFNNAGPSAVNNALPLWNKSSVTVSQTETIYLFDSDKKMHEFFKTVSREDGARNMFNGKDVKEKNKMLDRDLLKDYLSSAIYSKVEKYTHDNDLKLKVKEDFLKVLDYLETIMPK